jgi:hypothetical protein
VPIHGERRERLDFVRIECEVDRVIVDVIATVNGRIDWQIDGISSGVNTALRCCSREQHRSVV